MVNKIQATESESHLRALLENAADFAVYRIAVDRDSPYGGRVVMVSPSLTDIVGITEPYHFESWFEAIHPEDRARVEAANRRAWENAERYDEVARFYNKATGQWVWVHTISTPTFDVQGRLTHFNGFVIDVTGQKQAQAALQEHVAFEALVTSISTTFINLEPQEIDRGITQALGTIGEFDDVDRAYVFAFASDGKTMRCTHEWCAQGIDPQIHRMNDVPIQAVQWSNERLLQGETLHIPRVADLPPEAESERVEFTLQGTQSLVAVPMTYRGRVTGFLGLNAVRHEKFWPAERIALLQIVGEVFVNALEHKRAQAIQGGQREFLELLATGGVLSETLHSLVHLLEKQWPGMLGLVLLLDEDGKHLHVGAYGELPKAYVMSIEGLAAGPNVGSCGTACFTGKRVIVQDIATDPRWKNLCALALQYGLRACWSEPVIDRNGKVVGTFAMYYRHPRTPTEEELRTIEMGAHLVGVAVERWRVEEALQHAYDLLEQRVEERTEELQTLIGVQQAITSRLDPDAVLKMVIHKSRRMAEAQNGMVLMRDGDELEIAAVSGDRPADMVGKRVPLHATLTAHCVRTGQPHLLKDTEELGPEIAERGRRAGIRSMASVPLFIRGQSIGVISVGHAEPNRFADKHVRLLATLSSSAAIALENARLYRAEQARLATAERRREVAEGLRDIFSFLNSNHSLEEILDYIAVQTRALLGATATLIRHGDQERRIAHTVASCNLPADFEAIQTTPLYLGTSDQTLMRHEPVVLPDLRAVLEPVLAHEETLDTYQRAGLHAELKYFRSSLAVPLFVQNKIYGALRFYYAEQQLFSDADVQLAMALGDQVALAIENARLYQAEQDRRIEAERRRQVAEGLRDILAYLNSDRTFAEILDYIVYQASELLGANAGVIYSGDLKTSTITVEAGSSAPQELLELGTLPNVPEDVNRALLRRQPYTVANIDKEVTTDLPVAVNTLDVQLIRWKQTIRQHYRAYLAVPLLIKDELYGALVLYYVSSREFSEEDTNLGMALGGQVALAIENARLRDQAEESAVAAERNRLARDLHDAVTQTLFSASIIAEALPILWDHKPEEGRKRLQELRELTRGALAEMRTLLLELRPAALVEAQMGELLRQLTEAVTGRARIPVSLEVTGGDHPLPPDLKVGLYRILQEALNNVVKHAEATRAWVTYHASAAGLMLSIQDNGKGFDPHAVPTNHLGVGIMSERAQSLGGRLEIHSQIGQGTEIAFFWPDS